MLRSPKTNQRKERRLSFHIDGSGPTLAIGNGLGTLVENSDGNYTITYTKAFARAPIALCSTITDLSTLRVITCTKSAVNIEQVGADQTTPLADADFYLEIIGWDVADEYTEAS